MVEVEKHLKIAFEAYKKNIIPIILSVIIVIAVFFIFIIPAALLIFFENQNISTLETSQYNNLSSSEFQALFLSSSVAFSVLLFILGFLVALFLSSGLIGVCYYSVKKKVYIDTFFNVVKERGIYYFVATLLVVLLYLLFLLPFLALFFVFGFGGGVYSTLLGIFSILLMLGTLLITPFFMLYAPAVISGKSILESLSQSFNLGKKNYLDLVIIIILFYVFSFVNLIPIIGFVLQYFFLFPFLQITLCSFYIDKTVTNKRINKTKTIETTKKIKKTPRRTGRSRKK
jgi:hypothetical protein